jgi:hypothetical protein
VPDGLGADALERHLENAGVTRCRHAAIPCPSCRLTPGWHGREWS